MELKSDLQSLTHPFQRNVAWLQFKLLRNFFLAKGLDDGKSAVLYVLWDLAAEPEVNGDWGVDYVGVELAEAGGVEAIDVQILEGKCVLFFDGAHKAGVSGLSHSHRCVVCPFL